MKRSRTGWRGRESGNFYTGITATSLVEWNFIVCVCFKSYFTQQKLRKLKLSKWKFTLFSYSQECSPVLPTGPERPLQREGHCVCLHKTVNCDCLQETVTFQRFTAGDIKCSKKIQTSLQRIFTNPVFCHWSKIRVLFLTSTYLFPD